VLKGRWAEGIAPRNFAWIVRGRLAVSERPGGYAPNHRKVRRHEEILWLEAQGFTRVVSLLPSQHNLRAYEELGLPAVHFGLPPKDDVRGVLVALYPAMLGWLRDDECILLHQDELSERVAGVAAGFLCWCGLLPDAPRAIYAVEQLVRRQLGSAGRSIVGLAAQLPPPAPAARTAPAAPAARTAPGELDVVGKPVTGVVTRRASRTTAEGRALSVVRSDHDAPSAIHGAPAEASAEQGSPAIRSALAPSGASTPRVRRERTTRPTGAPESHT